MNENIRYGIVGLITLLLGFGGNMLLTEDELDNAYFCSVTEEFGIFYGGISGTALTAYPFAENRTQYKRCTGGVWVSVIEYAEEKGINPLMLIGQLNPEVPVLTATQWRCPSKGEPCVII